MEVVHQLKGVFQPFRRFPSEFIVTNTTDKVFQSFSDKFGVKDLFNLKFDVVVNDYSVWGKLFQSKEWVGGCGFTNRYVEHWVAFHGSGEV